MKGLKTIVKKSQAIDQHDRNTWISIYYDFSTKAVSTRETDNNFYVTKLIRPCSEKDVIDAIERWRML